MKVKQERADVSWFFEMKRGTEGEKSGNQEKKYKSDSGSSSWNYSRANQRDWAMRMENQGREFSLVVVDRGFLRENVQT